MIWTQWGLKDRLVADPDIWLCYECGDCSTRCPRGARPADVMAAVRKESILHYAVPGFVGRWINEEKNLPLLLAIPAVLLIFALLLKGALGIEAEAGHAAAAGTWQYADLFPHWLLIGFFTLFSGAAVVGAVLGVVRFWGAMKAADAREPQSRSLKPLGESIVQVLKDIFVHGRFAKCGANEPRYVAHLAVFYGFVGLFLATVWAVVVMFVLIPLAPETFSYPFSFWNPVKILANVSTVALIAGCALMIRDRRAMGDDGGVTTPFDRNFVWLLLGIGVTGLVVELLRFGGVKSLGYTFYFVHLVLVFSLLVYLPYSKFAHVFYRTAALVYAEHSGRNRAEAGEG